MIFNELKVGFALTGSFCTFENVLTIMKDIVKKGAEVFPIMSFNAYNLDTRFGKANNFVKEIENITGKQIIHTIQEAEPIGPKKLTDIMVIVPCSRKYSRKNGKWNYRYTSFNGCKISFKERKSTCNRNIYK